MGANKTVILSIAAAVLIAAVVLFALNYPRLKPEDTEVRLPDVPVSEAGDKNGDGADNASASPEGLTVSPDNVREVIKVLSRAESYHRVLKAESFWSGGSAEYSIETWAGPEGVRVVSRRTGEDEAKNFLLLGTTLYVWYGNERNYYKTEVGGLVGDAEHLADEFQMIPTYEDVLALKKSDIADAGYAVLDGTRYIFVKTVKDSLGNEDSFYISLETGLLEMAETVNNGETVYRMETESTELELPASSVFALPG